MLDEGWKDLRTSQLYCQFSCNMHQTTQDNMAQTRVWALFHLRTVKGCMDFWFQACWGQMSECQAKCSMQSESYRTKNQEVHLTVCWGFKHDSVDSFGTVKLGQVFWVSLLWLWSIEIGLNVIFNRWIKSLMTYSPFCLALAPVSSSILVKLFCTLYPNYN